MESSDVRNILESYRQRVVNRLYALKDDLLGQTENMTAEELVCEFAKWAQEVVNQEYEGLRNGTK